MGLKSSKENVAPLTESEFKDLASSTNFTVKELKAIHKQFAAENPSGKIDRKELAKVTGLLGFEDSFLIQRLFQIYDKDGNGEIDFKECVAVLSTMLKGDVKEKLTFVFSVYDIDGNGEVTRAELLKVVESLVVTLGTNVEFPPELDSPEKVVDKFFREADLNADGKVTLEEFVTKAQADPSFMKGLSIWV